MPSREDVNSQISLLNTYRRNLQMLLRQRGLQGANNVALCTQNSIIEARSNINRLKNILNGWGVDVEDHVDDTEPVYAQPEMESSIPVGTKVKIEVDNNNKILVMPNAVFAMFRKAMERDYGIDITEFVIE